MVTFGPYSKEEPRLSAYEFSDALSGNLISLEYPGLEGRSFTGEGGEASCRSLFFPGCSFLNYALPLVDAVYRLLREAGSVDGISLLCCGKVLAYEPDGKAVQARFFEDLVRHVADAGIERIVAACPNCVGVLKPLLASHAETASIEIVALPAELARLGYRIDEASSRELLMADWEANRDYYEAEFPASKDRLRFALHDSCPDRKDGIFADGLRALTPESLCNEMEHNRVHSRCCGSLVRAAGKYDLADAQARARAQEGVDTGADAVLTACVSCAFQMTMAQRLLPVYHYLELLFNWRIGWATLAGYLKIRFLFDESLGVEEVGGESSHRSFAGLGTYGAES